MQLVHEKYKRLKIQAEFKVIINTFLTAFFFQFIINIYMLQTEKKRSKNTLRNIDKSIYVKVLLIFIFDSSHDSI